MFRKNPVDLMISSSSSGLASRHRRRRAVLLEQRGRHHVHALVGALGAENRGDEELKRRLEVERAVRVGIVLREPLVDLGRALGCRARARLFAGGSLLDAGSRVPCLVSFSALRDV